MIKGMSKYGDMVNLGDGICIICLNSGEYKVDGNKVNINGYSIQQYTIKEGSEILRKIVNPRKLDHIVDKDGNNIPTSVFYSKRQNVTEPFEDEDGNLNFPDIDTEYRVKKQLQEMDSWEKVYTEESVEWKPVEINFLGAAVDTGSPFIDCAIALGQTSFNGGMFNVRLGDAAKQAFYDAAKGHSTDCPTHSHLEYAKIDGEYLFTNDTKHWIKQAAASKVCKSLEEAQKELITVQNYVTRKVKLKIAEQKGKTLENGQLVSILSQVRKIRSELSSVVPVKRTEGSYRQSTKLLNSMVESLEEILLED